MRTSVVLRKKDVKEAKALGINISYTCRKALFLEIVKRKKEIKKEFKESRASS